jgi:hypothetical protein
MLRICFAIILGSLLVSCENKDLILTDDCPTCFASILNKVNAPLEIWAYKYNNQAVFLAVADCCDQYNFLYDSKCNQLCAPSGGFSGSGDGKCADFNDKATDGKLVWKKE